MSIFMFILGVLIGSIITQIVLRSISIGNLNIDRSDPYESPYMFLELHKDVRYLLRKKYVTLTVTKENYLSQK